MKLLLLSVVAATGVAFGSVDQVTSGAPALELAEYRGRFVVFQDSKEFAGLGFAGGWRDRKITLIYDSQPRSAGGLSFDPGDHFPAGWDGGPIFPFDQNRAFTYHPKLLVEYGRVVGEQKGFRLITWTLETVALADADIYVLARERYGLSPKQNFLGCLDSKIFYWIDGEMDRIYWFSSDDRQVLHVKSLPRGVLALHGVTKGVKNDFCLIGVKKNQEAGAYSPNGPLVLDLLFGP